MTNPTWAPTATDVGSYVPMRTVELGNTTGSLTGTFSTLTTPTLAQVAVYIVASVEAVEAAVGATLDLTLYDLATQCAAVRAAAEVELAQPSESRDLRTYEQLLALFDSLLARLVARNSAVTGTSGVPVLTPVYVFPEPPWHADVDL